MCNLFHGVMSNQFLSFFHSVKPDLVLLSYYVKIELLWGSRCAHSPQVLQSLCLSPIILPTNHFNTAGAASIGPWTSCGSTPWGSGEVEGAWFGCSGEEKQWEPSNKSKTSNIKPSQWCANMSVFGWTGWILERFMKIILCFCL